MAFHLVLRTALLAFGCECGALADTSMRAAGYSGGAAKGGPTFLDLSTDASSVRQSDSSDEPRQLTGSGCTCLECSAEWQLAVKLANDGWQVDCFCECPPGQECAGSTPQPFVIPNCSP
mmetsp:Transcript_88841/g.254406  ORF Transcript_88841/g.254406 Transcript_88841/m.254406 type:complete len:119 (+) Transcript_88841:92-448(+)